MPSSSPPCKDDDDKATQSSSNDKSKSGTRSPQTQRPHDEIESPDPSMVPMEEVGTRLVSRSAVPGDGQTFRDLPLSPTETSVTDSKLPPETRMRSKYHSDHVTSNSSQMEQKHDITDSTKETSLVATESKNLERSSHSYCSPSSSDTPIHTSLAKSGTRIPTSTTVSLGEEHVNSSIAATVRAALETTKKPSSTNSSEDKLILINHKPNGQTEAEVDSDKMSVGDKLVLGKKPRTSRKRPPQVKPGQSTGRWTPEEHQAFLEGLKVCGREWKKVASRIPTRTSAQIRSHAQKYFAKLQREEESAVIPDSHGACSGAATIPNEMGMSHMRPSVQRNMERILSNPAGAQREVEATMQALRERYRALQQRLERRQQNHQQSSGNISRIEEEQSSTTEVEDSVGARKRGLANGETNNGAMRTASSDDHSSASSGISAEELIALHVLGGALPRGDSSADASGNIRDTSMESQSNQDDASPSSASSSIASDDDESDTPKRQRRER